jgi:hypothetical protein
MRGPVAALRRLETREALLLAFFAIFIVLAKAALRWHLHIPGHVMFATALFLLLARACVPRFGAASAVGLLAGLVCAVLGMGKEGPLLVVRLLLPGLVVDVGSALPRWAMPETARGVMLGAAAGLIDFFPAATVEMLAGAPTGLVLQHALLAAGARAAFGALGGWAAAAILRRLRDHGIVEQGGCP